MTSPNPLDDVYDTLVQSLYKVPGLRTLVKEKNRIGYNQAANQEKLSVTSADLPELLVYCNGFSGTLHNDSDACRFTFQYSLQFSTGSFDSRIINQLLFLSLAGLLNWKSTVFALKFKDKPYVLDVRIQPSLIGASDEQANRQIRGWASVLTVELDLYFNTAEVLEFVSAETT